MNHEKSANELNTEIPTQLTTKQKAIGCVGIGVILILVFLLELVL